MTTVRFWAQGAPAVARCPCGGDLMLVEDPGPRVPVETQCASCGELTGIPHDLVNASAAAPLPTGVVPGSPEDFGF